MSVKCRLDYSIFCVCDVTWEWVARLITVGPTPAGFGLLSGYMFLSLWKFGPPKNFDLAPPMIELDIATLPADRFAWLIPRFRSRAFRGYISNIDITKAFDSVNYWKSFNKLLDDKIDKSIVAIIAFWYSKQEVCVWRHNTLSSSFSIGNGKRLLVWRSRLLPVALFSSSVFDSFVAVASQRLV